MNAQKKENVRTQKTCALIRKTFHEMLIEMDYNQISIKKLTERADINRRTFYLHYGSIDELLNELIDEIADGYIKMTNSLNGYYDQREIARAFLLYFVHSRMNFMKRSSATLISNISVTGSTAGSAILTRGILMIWERSAPT